MKIKNIQEYLVVQLRKNLDHVCNKGRKPSPIANRNFLHYKINSITIINYRYTSGIPWCFLMF